MQNLKKLLLHSFLISVAAGVSWAGQLTGGDFVMTKNAIGVPGAVSMASPDDQLALACGEPAAGNVSSEPTYNIISGYYAGRFGNWQTFRLQSSVIGKTGAKMFYQDHQQVGVAFDAPVVLTFSDQLDEATIAPGITLSITADHLGHASKEAVPFTTVSDIASRTVTIRPQGAWHGNTLYDVQATAALLSVDGFPLDQASHATFTTMLDPKEENVVTTNGLSMDIPAQSLSNYSAVLVSRDPVNGPLEADPANIREANEKARAAGGPYQVPLAIEEINAYGAGGNLLGPLSKPAEISIDYGSGLAAGPGLARPQTLSLWVLDTAHRLWVKIPASRNASGFHSVTAPVAHFSVYALMGAPDQSAADSFAFPVPWRPHGPHAGVGRGQTGDEADGIHFSSIPSECTIKIYTLSGDLVRILRHTDTGGLIAQEKWDVKTEHGEPAASGVYLWRVESPLDGKNGKLMVIR